jgi:hypothetical protein
MRIILDVECLTDAHKALEIAINHIRGDYDTCGYFSSADPKFIGYGKKTKTGVSIRARRNA